VRIGYVNPRKDMVKRPDVMDRFATVCHDDECSFTTEVVDQQLEEGVDREGLVVLVSFGAPGVSVSRRVKHLVNVPYRVENIGSCAGDHAGPRSDRVYGDPSQLLSNRAIATQGTDRETRT
jgi:hypothetical protein